MSQLERTVDVVVIGAGPAGVAAAIAATRAGAQTILLDEAATPGGHLRWEVADFEELPAVPAILPRSPLAEISVQEVVDSGIEFLGDTAVWGIFPGPLVAAYHAPSDTGYTFRATSVVIATGSADRVWPVKGWELPGFHTERDLLTRLHTELPPAGVRYGIIGGGDAALQVKAAIAYTGGVVAFESVAITKIVIEGDVRIAHIHDEENRADVDVVVQAFGQRIEPVLAIQAGAACTLHVGEAVPSPYLTPDGATTVPGIFVAGEAAGVQGDRWIYAHGERVGRAAANGAEPHPTPEPYVPDPNSFRRPYFPPPRDPSIVIDREQGVTLGEVQKLIDAGAWDINDIRRQTRAGMGSSNTSPALAVIATLLLWRYPHIEDVRLIARPRPPLRDVPFLGYLPETTQTGGSL